MNPNSQHQRWSKWVFVVRPGTHPQTGEVRPQDFDDIRARFARMCRRQFGTTGQANVEHHHMPTHLPGGAPNPTEIPMVGGYGHWWLLEALVETDTPHDPQYEARMVRGWTRFFTEGFGPGTRVHVGHKLMAGDWQGQIPGKPHPDQLVIADLQPASATSPEDAQARALFRRLLHPRLPRLSRLLRRPRHPAHS